MSSGYLLAWAAALMWGLTYALDQKLLADLPAAQLLFFQSLAGVLLAVVLWLGRGGAPGGLFALEGVRPGLLVFTLLVSAGANLSILGSIQALGASRAAILEISYPLFVVVFSWVLFREAIPLTTLAGGVLIFLGAALVMKG